MIAAHMGSSKVAVTISGFQLIKSELSFDVNGSLPAQMPASLPSGIFLVNPNVSASPGFALASFIKSSNDVFTVRQPLRFSLNPIETGGSAWGDYFFIAFDSDLFGNRR
jgi:hypothetical protein